MHRLIIKEYMRTKRLQHILLADSAQEKHLVYTHVPCAQSTDNPLVSRRTSGRNKSRTDRCLLCGKVFLQIG